MTLRPTDRLTALAQINSSRLSTESEHELIVRQRILRGSLQYQFSKQLFVRLIAEHNRTRRATDVGQFHGDRSFSFEPMVSYKMNPFTVFYLGGNVGGWLPPKRVSVNTSQMW